MAFRLNKSYDMLIKYQLRAERVLPELSRAAGNKLCCYLIILSDWDLQNRTQCRFVTMLGEKDPGLFKLYHSSVFAREAEAPGPNPTSAHAIKHRPTSAWSARASAYTLQSHHVLNLTSLGDLCKPLISHLEPKSSPNRTNLCPMCDGAQ